MKKYIKPTMKAINIDVKESILQDSEIQLQKADEPISESSQVGVKWHNTLWDDDEEDD